MRREGGTSGVEKNVDDGAVLVSLLRDRRLKLLLKQLVRMSVRIPCRPFVCFVDTVKMSKKNIVGLDRGISLPLHT